MIIPAGELGARLRQLGLTVMRIRVLLDLLLLQKLVRVLGLLLQLQKPDLARLLRIGDYKRAAFAFRVLFRDAVEESIVWNAEGKGRHGAERLRLDIVLGEQRMRAVEVH